MKKHSLILSRFILMALVIGLFLLTSCATGPAFKKIETIPENMGLVYIYRSGKMMGAAISYKLRANGVVVTTLTPGGYYPYITKPGEIEFSAKTEATSSVTIDVKPGETHYIKGTIGVGFLVGRPHLVVVPTDVGEKEIAKCKLLQETKEERK
jgi:hypothetical protein